MKIGLFSDTYFPLINGCSASMQMLKKGLEEQGHTVYIVTINPKEIKYLYEKKDKILRIPGVRSGIFDYRITSVYPVKAMKKIKSWNLDVIHSQTDFGVGTFARIIAKQLKIPLVHTYHTMYENHKIYLTKGHFDKTTTAMVKGLTKFYCDKLSNQLIVPTKKAYDLLKFNYNLKIDTHIIGSGIDVEKFDKKTIGIDNIEKKKKQLGITNKDFVTIYLGRLGEEKNIEFLIKNHIALVKKNKNLKLLIVGGGPIEGALRKIVEKANCQGSVIFTGFVSYDEVPLYYNLADLFVLASTTETQGLTVIESMAAGVPPLCIEDESYKSYLIDNYNGRFFKNKRDYKKILVELLKNKKELESLSNQASLSSENFSYKIFANKVLKVYERAIKKYSKENKKRNISKIRRKKAGK